MWWHKTCAWTLQQPTWSCPKQRMSQTAREFILSLGVSSQNLICQPCTWPSEAGRLGRPEPPHFSWQMFIVYSRVPRLTSTLRWLRRARGRESVHVVNINHVLPSGSWIAELCEFYSWVIVMYSSRLPVPTIDDKAHQPSCFRFLQRDFGRRRWWSDRFSGSGPSSVAWPRLTELEIGGCKYFWKRRFLVFKVRKCHQSPSW